MLELAGPKCHKQQLHPFKSPRTTDICSSISSSFWACSFIYALIVLAKSSSCSLYVFIFSSKAAICSSSSLVPRAWEWGYSSSLVAALVYQSHYLYYMLGNFRHWLHNKCWQQAISASGSQLSRNLRLDCDLLYTVKMPRINACRGAKERSGNLDKAQTTRLHTAKIITQKRKQ